MLLGLLFWFFVLKSGVHATLAGVATAFAVPLRVPANKQSSLEPLEHDLHSLVTFCILPFFVFDYPHKRPHAHLACVHRPILVHSHMGDTNAYNTFWCGFQSHLDFLPSQKI